VDLVGSVPVEKSFVRHGWTLIGHAGGDLLYVEKKASEGSPTKVRNISYLDATVGNVGKPDPSAALEFFIFL
jgi:hypothetical protein